MAAKAQFSSETKCQLCYKKEKPPLSSFAKNFSTTHHHLEEKGVFVTAVSREHLQLFACNLSDDVSSDSHRDICSTALSEPNIAAKAKAVSYVLKDARLRRHCQVRSETHGVDPGGLKGDWVTAGRWC